MAEEHKVTHEGPRETRSRSDEVQFPKPTEIQIPPSTSPVDDLRKALSFTDKDELSARLVKLLHHIYELDIDQSLTIATIADIIGGDKGHFCDYEAGALKLLEDYRAADAPGVPLFRRERLRFVGSRVSYRFTPQGYAAATRYLRVIRKVM